MSPIASIQEAQMADTQPEPEANEGLEEIKQKILHILEFTPYLTRGMIQIGLSPAISPKLWDPLLHTLVDTGQVLKQEVSTESPGGRSQQKIIFHLPKFPYPPVTSAEYEGLNPQLQSLT